MDVGRLLDTLGGEGDLWRRRSIRRTHDVPNFDLRGVVFRIFQAMPEACASKLLLNAIIDLRQDCVMISRIFVEQTLIKLYFTWRIASDAGLAAPSILFAPSASSDGILFDNDDYRACKASMYRQISYDDSND